MLFRIYDQNIVIEEGIFALKCKRIWQQDVFLTFLEFWFYTLTINFHFRNKMTAINVRLTNNHNSHNLSRNDIIHWINSILNTNYNKIEELSTGSTPLYVLKTVAFYYWNFRVTYFEIDRYQQTVWQNEHTTHWS